MICDSHKHVAERELPPVVQKLKRWRKKNHLSQRQAAAVMHEAGYPVLVSSLRSWEIGKRSPNAWVSKALEAFLKEHPTVTNPPQFGRWIRREEK